MDHVRFISGSTVSRITLELLFVERVSWMNYMIGIFWRRDAFFFPIFSFRFKLFENFQLKQISRGLNLDLGLLLTRISAVHDLQNLLAKRVLIVMRITSNWFSLTPSNIYIRIRRISYEYTASSSWFSLVWLLVEFRGE